jgi:outer membrane protein assembly factor BamB
VNPAPGYLLAIVVVTSGMFVLGAPHSPVPFTDGTAPSGAGPGVSPASSPPPPRPWPTYMANVERTSANLQERAIAPSNVSELQPVWTVPDNGSDFSAPIVVDGTVYYGSWSGNETAVNVTTGAVEWSTYLGTDPSCGGYTPMGISSTPAYLDGTLFLGGGDGYWYALNASTGQTIWRYLVGTGADGFYDWASALLYGHSLYIGIASCFDSPLVPAGLIELNVSGAPTLTAQFNTTPPGQVGESIWTTPAMDPENHTLWLATGNENPPGYPINANAIVGLNSTTLNVSGSWQVPNVAGQDSDFGSTPLLFQTASGVPMVVASNKNGVAYALNRSNISSDGSWAPAWELNTEGGFSGGAFDGQTLYLAGGSTVYAVDPANGSVLWTAGMDGGGGILGSLSWANGLVYAAGGGAVEAIDAANGTVLWSYTLPGGQSAVTEPVVADGHLFVASGDYGTAGYLTAFALPNASLHRVTFTETGLPTGRAWSASLGGLPGLAGGATVQTTSTSATLPYVPNGTYSYLVRSPAGFRVLAIPGIGNLTVAAGNVTIAFQFVRGASFALTFLHSGLPRGTSWCVTVVTTTCTPAYAQSLRGLTAGTYPYSITSLAGYIYTVRVNGLPSAIAGWVALLHRGATVGVRFAQAEYDITFTETGLPASRLWVVRLKGEFNGAIRIMVRESRTDTLSIDAPNGTFAYTIEPVIGFTGSGTGTVSVGGSPTSVTVTFVPVPPAARPGSFTLAG